MGFAMNAYKMNQIFPPPTNPELSSNKNQSALPPPELCFCLSFSPAQAVHAAQDAQPVFVRAAVLKNFLRGALLAFFATFLGVFLFFTFPDMVAGTLLRRPMPFWFYENEVRQSS